MPFPSDENLAIIKRQFPTLDRYGFDTPPPENENPFDTLAVVICATFFERYCKPTQRVRGWSSYFWKKVIEQAAGQYIANGDCIAGASLAGFRVIPDEQGPNARFALSVSDSIVREWIRTGQNKLEISSVTAEIWRSIDSELLS